MIDITITITTRSYVLIGSGEGSALVDTDTVFHGTGFPYIPAKRVKGLLKENMLEVLEVLGKSEQEICFCIDKLFGKSGDDINRGKLIFTNLYVEGWKDIEDELKGGVKGDIPLLDPDSIKAYYTTEIYQTSIDSEMGIAKDGTLRNYRVLNPQHTFSAAIMVNGELSEEEMDYLQKAALSLRYAGIRRNRGFGNVICRISLKKELPVGSDNNILSVENDRLCVNIRTLSSVVLGQQKGDQNTVYTARQISGNQVRGMLIQRYLRKRNLSSVYAHRDEQFYALFLSGAITYSTLYFEDTIPLPEYIHTFKVDEERLPVNVFKQEEGITRTLRGFGHLKGRTIEKRAPVTTSFFHQSRENRAAGRSIENQESGGIFYYEAIDEAQTFTGYLQGPQHLLQELINQVGTTFDAQLGKSRSAQYGRGMVSLRNDGIGNADPVTVSDSQTYLLTLLSPLLLLNEHGEPEPGERTLRQYISKKLGLAVAEKGIYPFEIEKVAAGFLFSEQYNASWRSKSGRMPVYKEGSAFLLKFNVPINNDLLHTMQQEGLGEWRDIGLGKIRWTANEEVPPVYEIKKNSSHVDKPIPDVQHPTLRAIQEKTNLKNRRLEMEKAAIERAQVYPKSLKNHLVARLERKIDSLKNEQDIREFIALLRGKPAGEALGKSLLNELEKFNVCETGKADSFEITKAYWITFFRTLRLIQDK